MPDAAEPRASGGHGTHGTRPDSVANVLQVDRPHWPLPGRAVDHVVLDSRGTTIAYYGGVVLVVAGLFVTRLLPCVDYPQHLALADVARRLLDPAAPEQTEYQLNYFTYNALFHLVVARLSAFVPIEVAGRCVVAASLFATAGGVVALVRVLRRPPAYAALFTPALFSFSVGWGFVNYVAATAIAVWALVFVARASLRPSLGAAGTVGALGMLCAFAHVLVMLILCATATALALELACRVAPRGGPRGERVLWVLARVTSAGLPLLLGCAYCIAVNHRQYAWAPSTYRDPTMEGTGPPLWAKVVFFGNFATGLFRDTTDQVVVWLAIVVMGGAMVLAWNERRSGSRAPEQPPPIVGLLGVALIAYIATPSIVLGTHLIFQRLAQWVMLGALLATPRFPPRSRVGRASGRTVSGSSRGSTSSRTASSSGGRRPTPRRSSTICRRGARPLRSSGSHGRSPSGTAPSRISRAITPRESTANGRSRSHAT